jgi:hypothetical protein
MKGAVIVCVALAMAACTPVQTRPVSTAPIATSRKIVKSYTLGEQKEVFVGQAAVAVKDYYVSKTFLPMVAATSRMRLLVNSVGNCSADSAVAIPVTRETTLDGVTELVVPLACGASIMVGPDGTVARSALVANDLSIPISPPSTKFVRTEREEIDTKSGYLNYELLFGGTDGKAFTLTYREYTPENMARSAFSQTLTFEATAKTIRFRNLRLTIKEVTSEHLLFSVVSDTEA